MLTYEQIEETIETLCKIEGEKVGGILSAEIRDCVFALQKAIETIGKPTMSDDDIKEVAQLTCPKAYGFEGPDTYHDCGVCIVCRCKKKIKGGE